MKKNIQSFSDKFTETAFFKKISDFGRQAGTKIVYTALLLYYAYRKKETPQWARNIVLGALGYFISPIDFLPDITPFVGYTDDLGVLGVGLSMIAFYIDDAVKADAKTTLDKWFDNYNEIDLTEIDEKIR